MAQRSSPRWRRVALLVVVEPPFVPRLLWPRTIAAAVLDRLPGAIDTVLDRIDLTQLVIDHVSVPRIVESIDVDALLQRLDISGIVTKVIDDVDLPDIIRDSTGAMASESVIGVRMQSVSADDAIDRLAQYLIPGRRHVQPAEDGTG
jgi:hypothetical protein